MVFITMRRKLKPSYKRIQQEYMEGTCHTLEIQYVENLEIHFNRILIHFNISHLNLLKCHMKNVTSTKNGLCCDDMHNLKSVFKKYRGHVNPLYVFF